MHREPELKWYTGYVLSCRSITVLAFLFLWSNRCLITGWKLHSPHLFNTGTVMTLPVIWSKKKITALVRLKEYLILYNVELHITCIFFKPRSGRPADSTEMLIYLFTKDLFSEKEKIKEGVVLRDTDSPAEKQGVWLRNLFSLFRAC